ncbi:uncharacterized protein L969DRAFT_70630 [Mixia osmundae IAM 14324]|uniref:UBC core domain-containing protein n=1 Tax=Mixia osmundae (strain CBS 9802 / IAM 14324 / JCM 22182 / KY 12970) TaxID=764103 RepID=G7DXG4_MIXOS|nr:uncharacterized protein L969DRAFT_70630 [Mixia osmundae IAM 14324]KEI41232.1 hypothetical protein L969DRAFT_70630 [Mixia osmundae IAM 14324]GAA95274.1 hypothetical protein E5Q_01930 [Mixia osmundae IAM 14324]
MAPLARRLLAELSDYRRNASSFDHLLSLSPVSDEDLLTWHARLKGPKDSPFEDFDFDLSIKVPEAYPSKPPSIYFTTQLCHPNVAVKTGEICLDVLQSEWSPAWTLASACTAVQALLACPEPSSPLNVDAANLVRSGDKMAYYSIARLRPALLSFRIATVQTVACPDTAITDCTSTTPIQTRCHITS